MFAQDKITVRAAEVVCLSWGLGTQGVSLGMWVSMA